MTYKMDLSFKNIHTMLRPFCVIHNEIFKKLKGKCNYIEQNFIKTRYYSSLSFGDDIYNEHLYIFVNGKRKRFLTKKVYSNMLYLSVHESIITNIKKVLNNSFNAVYIELTWCRINSLKDIILNGKLRYFHVNGLHKFRKVYRYNFSNCLNLTSLRLVSIYKFSLDKDFLCNNIFIKELFIHTIKHNIYPIYFRNNKCLNDVCINSKRLIHKNTFSRHNNIEHIQLFCNNKNINDTLNNIKLLPNNTYYCSYKQDMVIPNNIDNLVVCKAENQQHLKSVKIESLRLKSIKIYTGTGIPGCKIMMPFYLRGIVTKNKMLNPIYEYYYKHLKCRDLEVLVKKDNISEAITILYILKSMNIPMELYYLILRKIVEYHY